MKYCLAIDIGASSGRHIAGWQEGGRLVTRELYRFPNNAENKRGHLVWDADRLFREVVNGIKAAFAELGAPQSVSVDTWGVDYVLMNEDVSVYPCYAYRDDRTSKSIPEVHRLVPQDRLYSLTGCQFQPFNTIYQLYDDLIRGRLDKATDFLMMPEYLMYRLTGVKSKEYTNAVTTGLVNAFSGEFDSDIINDLGLPKRLFLKLDRPGTVLGTMLPEIAEEVGGNCSVVLCATHDTASAVEGIPMSENQPYISSGTWSLLGVKVSKPITDEVSRIANYSNEGGVGYIRYQKNIMGLWLVQQLRRELCPDMDFSEIAKEAERSSFNGLVDADSQEFLAPESMKSAFDKALGSPAITEAAYIRCAYRSLARSYAKAMSELERNTGRKYDKLYVVGGGAKNDFLTRLTAESTGKQVIALPIEATALGNLKIQMEAMK